MTVVSDKMGAMSPASPATSAVVPPFVADRASPVPLYFQVATHLENAIASGQIPPGTLFSNEIQLADEMGLSRPTMRRAMQHLVDKGLIVRRRGIGTRVVQPKVRRPLELTSLYDDLAGTGQEPTTRVLSFETVDASPDVATALVVEPGTPVVQVVRLRSALDRPLAKMTNFLPTGVVEFDAPTLERRGLYGLLRAQGIILHSATQTVGARNANSEEARLLDEPKGAALLTMSRTTYDDHGNVVEYGTHLYAASRYSFDINLLTP